MEINYDLIIKYLVTKKTIFASKKHILINSDLFPDKFREVFLNKFYRYGINQNDGFYNMLLTLLNKDFIMYSNEEEEYEVKQLKVSLNNFHTSIDDIHIKYLSNLLQINLLVFDFKTENIRSFFCSEECNPYKPTLLIANYDNFYEPIISDLDNKKIFSYNDTIIKKIYQILNIKLNDNVSELLEEFEPQTDSKIFVGSAAKYTEPELNKLTKEKLLEILNQKNGSQNEISRKMLKKDIIKLIL